MRLISFLGELLKGLSANKLPAKKLNIMAILKKKIVFGPPISAKAHLQELELNTRILEDTKKALTQTLDAFEIERAQLEKAKLKDEAILSSIGEVLVVTDHDMKVSRINAVGEKMLGWRQEELLGKEWFQFVKMIDERGKKIPLLQTPFGRALTTTTTTTTSQFVRKDGTIFPATITASQIKMGQDLFGVVVVFRDITKEKEIDKAKNEFISLASHQLRTPLTAINWYVEMLQSDDAGKLMPEQKKYLDEVYKGNQRMVKLVSDLLNLSRLETGRIKIDPVPVQLEEFIADVLADCRGLTKYLTCAIRVVTPKKPLSKIMIDPTLLHQVLLNLCTNAIRYSPRDRQCEIVITLVQAEDSIVISVADQGIGIPPETQGRVFEKFFRADNAQSIEAEGSGLGLYLAKKIMDVSGGKIWFESEAGKGSVFYLSIPMGGMTEKQGEVGFAA